MLDVSNVDWCDCNISLTVLFAQRLKQLERLSCTDAYAYSWQCNRLQCYRDPQGDPERPMMQGIPVEISSVGVPS